jgi:hypothetical protein
MSKRAKDEALEAYPDKVFRYKKFGDADGVMTGESIKSQQYIRDYFIEGYEQAEKDILSIIESRLSELLGDAQPTPILRYELMDLVKKIKED